MGSFSRFGVEADVVEVVHDAAVAVVAGVLGAADFEGEHKIRDAEILDECDVQGAAVGRLVVALTAVDAEDGVAIDHSVGPAFFISDFPAVATFLEVFGEEQGKTVEGVGCGAGDEGEEQTEE